jgi:ATP-dependent RNA helicase DeaD
MCAEPSTSVSFVDFALSEPLQRALNDSGYEIPTPIQALIIPVILAGKDVLGQAQTGTGKTAAFALPLLERIDLQKTQPQVLVLAPTRELAIQVTEAFKKYGAHLPGLKVLAIYGGQEYGPQLRGLSRGAHVVVGTPGRVMDHITRESLQLDALMCLVLDEADEMLKMGFKEDVEWVLEHTPDSRQIALFSATLPAPIRAIAKKYLKEPEEIIIRNKTSTVELTRQRYWFVSRINKLDALSRLLEVEPFDAVLVFVRTKTATMDIAEQLQARGFAAAPLNGDIQQSQRERTIEQLKSGRLNIIIATDVAARGLDVERISHVINYDIPYDTEAYIHRIGRTGRAGRSGEAILFVSMREKRMLQTIERATRQKITEMELPSVTAVNAVRTTKFKKQITETLAREKWKAFRDVMAAYLEETEAPPQDVAAALASMFYGDRPFLLEPPPERIDRRPEGKTARDYSSSRELHDRSRPSERAGGRERPGRGRFDGASPADSSAGSTTASEAGEDSGGVAGAFAAYARKTPFPHETSDRQDESKRPRKVRSHSDDEQEEGKIRYRIEVGRFHGVRPGQIMGAVAGETGIDGKSIGRITLFQEFSTIDLPDTMTEAMLKKLRRVRVVGRALMISRFDPDRADQESFSSPRSRAGEGKKPERFAPIWPRADEEKKPDRPAASRPRPSGEGRAKGAPWKRTRTDDEPRPESAATPRSRSDFGKRSEKPSFTRTKKDDGKKQGKYPPRRLPGKVSSENPAT